MPFIPVVTNIVSIGNMSVDIFLFFSGLCNTIGAQKHNYSEEGWRSFFRRRAERTLLPYFLIAGTFYLWSSIAEHSGSILRRTLAFAGNISSLSFWFNGTQTTWFVFAILLFYLLFPFIYRFGKQKGKSRRILFLAAAVLFSIASSYIPVLKNSTIVWSRLPIYTFGIFIGTDLNEYQLPEFSTRKRIITEIISILIIITIGWLLSAVEIFHSISLPRVYRWLLYTPVTLALLTLLSFHLKPGESSRFLSEAGAASLEIYLIHVTMLHPIQRYGLMSALGMWLYPVLTAFSVLCAVLIRRAEQQIIKCYHRGKS